MGPVLGVNEKQQIGDAQQREEDERRPDGLLDVGSLGAGRGLELGLGHHDSNDVDEEQ